MSDSLPDLKAPPFPFPWFGHGLPEPGGDGHCWAIRFQTPVSEDERLELARLLLAPLTSTLFEQREGWSWLWREGWLVIDADERDGAPDTVDVERFEALASMETALIEVHARWPIAEVFAISGEAPTGTEWDTWSREDGREPPARGTDIFREGEPDPTVEELRLGVGG